MWNRTTTFISYDFSAIKTVCWKIYFVQKLKGLYFQRVEKGRWIASGHPTSGTGFSPNTYPTALLTAALIVASAERSFSK